MPKEVIMVRGLFDNPGLERETGFWENTVHELCRVQEKVRCGWLYFLCKEDSW